MSKSLAEFLADAAPVARTVKSGGIEIQVFFRRVSAGEKTLLLKGQKYQSRAGEKATIEIDLSETNANKHLLVSMSVCDESGKKFFNSVEDVKKLDAQKIEALYAAASFVNTEVDDPEKS